MLGHVFIYHSDLRKLFFSSRSSKFLENTGTPISISRKNRMSPIIILYQSSIRTQLTLKENLNIQNHNHYIICTRSFTPPVNCLNLVSPPFLLASHLVIVYKLHKLKGLVLTQASLFLIAGVRYNVRLQVNRKCVSYIRNNMNYKGLALRF